MYRVALQAVRTYEMHGMIWFGMHMATTNHLTAQLAGTVVNSC